MPEENIQQPAAPAAQPATPGPEAQPAAPAGAAPSGPPIPSPARQEIVERYSKLYGPAETPATPAAVPAAPAAVAGPAPAAAQPSDVNAIVQQLIAELASVKGQLAAQAQPAAAPAEKPDWLTLLSQGKKAEGEQALADKVRELSGEQLQNQAVEKALALIEMRGFADSIKAQNPDLLSMENYITMGAAQRLDAANKAGRIKSPADYVTVYKESVNAEIEKARQLALSFRGEGRQEGASRVAAVAASPTLAPSATNLNREQQPKVDDQQMESPADYLARRQAKQNSMKGMGGQV